MNKIKIEKCRHCGEDHIFSIKENDLNLLVSGSKILNFRCPKIHRYYNIGLGQFFFDARANHSKNEMLEPKLIENLKIELGNYDFDNKYKRRKEIEIANAWLIGEHFDTLSEIKKSYVFGAYYPAITSCCCLIERVMNILIKRLHKYYDPESLSKNIKKKVKKTETKFQNREDCYRQLFERKIISEETKNKKKVIKKIRDNAVHFDEKFNFRGQTLETITNTIGIIDDVFGIFNRTDLFSVREVPGETFVKQEVLEQPFVKEFVLPYCSYTSIKTIIQEDQYVEFEDKNDIGEKKLTTSDIIRLRKERNSTNKDEFKKSISSFLKIHKLDKRDIKIFLV